jgi:hypothetical protein
MTIDYFEGIIQQISDILLEEDQDEWEAIELVAEVSDQYSRFTATSFLDDEASSFLLTERQSMSLDDLFRNLQMITKKDGMEFWNQAVYRLSADGEFNIDFRYDDDEETKTSGPL